MMASKASDIVTLAIIIGLMSLIPLIVVSTTSFLKTSLVLLLVRNATGVQQAPPTMAIYGIALAITVFVMAPTFQKMADLALDSPHAAQQIDNDDSLVPMLGKIKTASEPMRAFMIKFSRPDQRAAFLDTAKRMWPVEFAERARDTDFLVLVPAFVVSELKTGYEIGFLIYIPFVVIDLLIANLLMALGMQQVSPQTLSVPLKLLLFVMADGWSKLLHGLALSYA